MHFVEFGKGAKKTGNKLYNDRHQTDSQTTILTNKQKTWKYELGCGTPSEIPKT